MVHLWNQNKSRKLEFHLNHWAHFGSKLTHGKRVTMGKFDWGVWYVIIFLYVQFWLRLAAESYRGKKVRTAASPAVRSVNESRDTRNCVQNEPEYVICVIFTTRLYYEALGSILMTNTPQLQSYWRWQLWRYMSPQDVSTGHGRCHGDNPWKFRNDVIV